jgi:hypothetical protein
VCQRPGRFGGSGAGGGFRPVVPHEDASEDPARGIVSG